MLDDSTDLPTDHDDRLHRARLSLEGLSLGDAFGQQFFVPSTALRAGMTRSPPSGPWHYTDDTEMALAIHEVLARHGRIDQDDLARTFARRYALTPGRSYGHGTGRILRAIGDGATWREMSAGAFGGEGSKGNGAAMRVAPLGAYFADDLAATAREADASAEITHFHAEARAGSIAVAVAAAWACQRATGGGQEDRVGLLRAAAEHTPSGPLRDGIQRATNIDLAEWEFTAAGELGNGSQVIAADTVPFCLWCAAAHLDNYPEALWAAVRVGGDIDTNAAIVGGIVALAVGHEGLPREWLAAREYLELAHCGGATGERGASAP
jgi:ADP-ribosylglycohydrolase